MAALLTAYPVAAASAASSPYPASLTMRSGLALSSTGRGLPWGAVLPVAQSRWVTLATSGSRVRWGVWREDGGPAQFPVRSTDDGARWAAAGPQLSSDWAGGSLYEVTRVTAESPSSVVMASDSVIDVTTDAGHQWYQYVHPAANWSITASPMRGTIGLRVAPARGASLPRGSYAVYVLDVADHRWRRTGLSTR